ncbi:MAG: HEAT repeat domain-containing protein [Anaerohalosphaeraceae bacterium]
MTKRAIQSVCWGGLVILLLAGCARKGKAVSTDDSKQALEEQIQTLRAELESVRNELAAERKLSLELAGLLRRCREGGGQAQVVSSEGVFPAAPGESNEQQQLLRKVQELTEAVERLREQNRRLVSMQSSQSAGAPAAQSRPRQTAVEVYTVEPSENQKLREAYEAFSDERASSERLAALESTAEMAMEQKPELLGLLEKALEDPDPEVVRTAAQMLELYQTSSVLPLLEKALHSRDEQVRLSALEPLEKIADPRSAALLVLALSDPSDAVRGRALDIIRVQPPDIQILSLKRAMGLSSDDVKLEVLSLLELRGDKAAVEVMLEGLKDPSPEFRDQVREVLRLLLDQEFAGYNQAVQWWKVNRARYDDNLLER